MVCWRSISRLSSVSSTVTRTTMRRAWSWTMPLVPRRSTLPTRFAVHTRFILIMEPFSLCSVGSTRLLRNFHIAVCYCKRVTFKLQLLDWSLLWDSNTGWKCDHLHQSQPWLSRRLLRSHPASLLSCWWNRRSLVQPDRGQLAPGPVAQLVLISYNCAFFMFLDMFWIFSLIATTWNQIHGGLIHS